MKKALSFLGALFLFTSTITVSVLYFPNELSFKIKNTHGIQAQEKNQYSAAKSNFLSALNMYPRWSLVAENNRLSVYYEEKKYDELLRMLKETIDKNCSLEAEEISGYCENIFYLEGITKYRIGERLEKAEQKLSYERAIASFLTVLALNPENDWAQENIDFILQKIQEDTSEDSSQQQQDSSEGGSEGEQKEEKSDQPQNEENADSETGAGSENEKVEGEEKPEEADSSENQEGESNADGESSQKQNDSRLPQEMQDAIEEVQKQLEDEQDQQGFYRSKSAQENNASSGDPFDQLRNDPFFQNFFGNDPFFSQPLGEKQFHTNISDPNEKDW